MHEAEAIGMGRGRHSKSNKAYVDCIRFLFAVSHLSTRGKYGQPVGGIGQPHLRGALFDALTHCGCAAVDRCAPVGEDEVYRTAGGEAITLVTYDDGLANGLGPG